MQRFSVFAVVLLVALSGCSALGGGGTTTQATTDQPVPTPIATDDGQSLPPGITTAGVDAAALVDAHESALADQSYTLTISQHTQNGSLTIDAQASAGTLPARVSYEATGANRTTYITESGGFERGLGGGQTTYSRVSANASAVPTGSSYLRGVLGDATFTYDGTVQRDGRTLHRLSAGGDDLTRQIQGAEVVGFEASVLVSEAGLVTDVDYRLTVTEGDTEQDLTVDMSLTDVGATTVSQPSWVGLAAQNGLGNTTRVLSASDLGTTLTVSGSTENVGSVALGNASAAFYDSDIVAAARVSPLVTVASPSPVTLDSVTMQYDDAAVPGGNENELFVFAYHPEYRTFLPMETRYDPVNDTAQATGVVPGTTVTLEGGETVEPTLSGLPNNTVLVVMHGQTYWANFENRNDN